MAAASNPLSAGVPSLQPPKATQTMISPDGQYGEIPVDRVQEAIKSGFKAGINMIAPDGSPGTIPIDSAHDAMVAGFKPSGLTLPESKLYAQHPANILYRNIRQNESPEQIAARQQTATNVSKDIQTAATVASLVGGGMESIPATVGAVAYGGLAKKGVEAGAKKLGVDDTTAGQLGDVASLGAGLYGGIKGGPEIAESEMMPHPLAKASQIASEMTGRTIAPELLTTKPASGQLQPALNNSPSEVINYAAQKGIDLTPAEASGKPVARTIQAVGERSLLGADQLEAARQENALKLAQNVRSFADTIDPKGMGLTEEGAGESIQHTARVARSVAHENATAAYDQAGIDQANLAGDLSPLKSMVKDETMVKQPGAAVARPEYKQPEVQAALDDIASKPDELGNSPSIQSMRNLRSEFLERSRTNPGEAQTAAQRLYGQAADTVDSQIMKAAQGTPFEDSFRDASQQWADMKQKYDQSGTVLNRILSQRDPATVTRSILNRGSANDIQILQNENMQPALDALKRQVVQDVANRGFRVNGDGLGGYSHSFITKLFGDSATKELYLNGELARRMGFQVNPSGTSNVLLGMEQLSPNPTRWAIPMGAAKASMPRPAASYLSEGGVSSTGVGVGVAPTTTTPQSSTIKSEVWQDVNGTTWAGNKKGVQVSVPKNIADTGSNADVLRYAAPKLEEQAAMQEKIKKSSPTKFNQNASVSDDMTDPDTRFAAATHEAGHAVVGELLNPGSVQSTGIGPKGGVTDILPPQGKKNISDLSIRDLGNMVATSLAGGLSEYGGTTPLHASGDMAIRNQITGSRAMTPIRNLQRATMGSGGANDPMLEAPEMQAEGQARVNALLADPSTHDMINAVANAIASKGRLSGDDVRAVMAKARGGRR